MLLALGLLPCRTSVGQQEVRIDLDQTSASATLTSAADLDYMTDVRYGVNSHTLAAGDLNGDGLPDVVMAARWSRLEAGAVFVAYGRADELPCLLSDRDLLSEADVTITGVAGSDLGASIAVADMDRDGFDDIAIGAPAYRGGPAATVYVVFGSATLFGQMSIAAPPGGVRILSAWHQNGPGNGTALGTSVAMGDLNSDGYPDLLAGDNRWWSLGRPVSGEAYVIWGSPTPPVQVDLSFLNPNHLTLYGPGAGSQMGSSVHIHGAFIGGPYFAVLDDNSALRAMILHGDGTLRGLLSYDMASTPSARTSALVERPQTYSFFAADISTADVDGDGSTDIILGNQSPGVSLTGRAFVIRGPIAPNTTLNVPTAGLTTELAGIDPGDAAGLAVGSGDLDGDGFADVLVGAQGSTALGGFPYKGEAYVVYGSASFFSLATRPLGETNPAVTRIATVYGRASEPTPFQLGSAVVVHDVDNDGSQDLVLGASWADGLGRQNAGQTYVFLTALLARSTEVTQVQPDLQPPRWNLFPLDFVNPPPVGHRYKVGFLSGSVDPDAQRIVIDRGRPLVFYQVQRDCNTLLLVKADDPSFPDTLLITF